MKCEIISINVNMKKNNYKYVDDMRFHLHTNTCYVGTYV